MKSCRLRMTANANVNHMAHLARVRPINCRLVTTVTLQIPLVRDLAAPPSVSGIVAIDGVAPAADSGAGGAESER